MNQSGVQTLSALNMPQLTCTVHFVHVLSSTWILLYCVHITVWSTLTRELMCMVRIATFCQILWKTVFMCTFCCTVQVTLSVFTHTHTQVG